MVAVKERSLVCGSSIHDDLTNLVIDQIDTLLTLCVQIIISGICPDFEVLVSDGQRIKDGITSVVVVAPSARNERVFMHFWDLESELIHGVDLVHLDWILLSSLEGTFGKVECQLIVAMGIESDVVLVSGPIVGVSVYLSIVNAIISSVEFLKHSINTEVSGNVFQILLIFCHIEEAAEIKVTDQV
jgi:hypothetical protein